MPCLLFYTLPSYCHRLAHPHCQRTASNLIKGQTQTYRMTRREQECCSYLGPLEITSHEHTLFENRLNYRLSFCLFFFLVSVIWSSFLFLLSFITTEPPRIVPFIETVRLSNIICKFNIYSLPPFKCCSFSRLGLLLFDFACHKAPTEIVCTIAHSVSHAGSSSQSILRHLSSHLGAPLFLHHNFSSSATQFE